MDAILLKSTVKEWNELCAQLDEYQSKLSAEEKEASDFLRNFWRTHKTITPDDIATCNEKCDILRRSEKYHRSDPQIATCTKTFRGKVQKMYTEANFADFKKEMESSTPDSPQPEPAPSPQPTRPTGGRFTRRPSNPTIFTPQPQPQPQPQPRPQPRPQPTPRPTTPRPTTPKPTTPKPTNNTGTFKSCLSIVIIGLLIFGGYKLFSAFIGDSSSVGRSETTLYVIAEQLNIRDQNGTNGKKIGSITYGQAVELIDTLESWAKVKNGGTEGYVSRAFLANESDFRLLDIILDTPEAHKTVKDIRYRRALIDFAQHFEPAKDASLYIGKLPVEVISLVRQYSQETFAFVLVNKTTGQTSAGIYTFDADGRPLIESSMENVDVSSSARESNTSSQQRRNVDALPQKKDKKNAEPKFSQEELEREIEQLDQATPKIHYTP